LAERSVRSGCVLPARSPANDNLNSDAGDWLEKAEEKPGSWWPDWDLWMERHSSGTVRAPAQLGNLIFM